MYKPDEIVTVFKVLTNGATEDLYETTIATMLCGAEPGADASDALDSASRRLLAGHAGGWRLLDTT